MRKPRKKKRHTKTRVATATDPRAIPTIDAVDSCVVFKVGAEVEGSVGVEVVTRFEVYVEFEACVALVVALLDVKAVSGSSDESDASDVCEVACTRVSVCTVVCISSVVKRPMDSR